MTCKKYAALFVLLFMTLAVKAKDYATFNLPVGAVTRLGKGTVKGAKIFHSSDRFAILTSVGVWIHNSNTGEEVTFFVDDFLDPTAFDISPDDSLIAVGTEKGNIAVWDIRTEQIAFLLDGHLGKVTIALSRNDYKLA